MKKILFLGALLFGFATASAQAPLEEGQMQVNGGVGFSNWGVPVYVGLDYGVHPDITVGGELSFQSTTASTIRYSAIGIMANGNYHFNNALDISSKYDIYAGASLGYYIWSASADLDGDLAHTSGLGFSGQVGGRYFFNDKFAINLEFGGGTASGGKLGVTYKL